MNKLPRVWHPVEDWEEIKFNMWGTVSDRASFLKRAIDFTGNWELYGDHMDLVILEWPISCENALTDYSLNRKAWVGHAACALYMQCPEDITRLAWGYLSDEQRTMANRRAAIAIRDWEENYRARKGLCGDVAQPMLL